TGGLVRTLAGGRLTCVPLHAASIVGLRPYMKNRRLRRRVTFIAEIYENKYYHEEKMFYFSEKEE
ncbi:MAG: hypothetical protein UH678_09395, partial [Fibrobacteraceae bacterium]|nr:hypothetical protein [Fibrobacteraceae bacterium]